VSEAWPCIPRSMWPLWGWAFCRSACSPPVTSVVFTAAIPLSKPMASTEALPEAAQSSSDLWKVSSVAVLGAFIAQMDATIVNVSLSSLALELHATLSNIQWVTSGYLLALALTLPLNGWLVDRIGVKALYLWCFAAFTLTSALCGLAWSANSLIGFRI